MSRVPCKKISNNVVSLENIFQDRLSSLGIREVFHPQGWKRSFAGFFIKRIERIKIEPCREGTILIFSSRAQQKLVLLTGASLQEYLAHLHFCKTALLIFCQNVILPDSMIEQFHHHYLPAASSSLHENLVQSRIMEIVQEKIKKRITVHGVVLEMQGKGILVTGPSGVGKTTTALQAVREGCIWIADDRAVVEKQQNGRLFVSGHRLIRDYFHTAEAGITSVASILSKSQIKDKTALVAVIDVSRTDDADSECRLLATEIMEIRLPIVKISVSRTGFFNNNLLGKAMQKLKEVWC